MKRMKIVASAIVVISFIFSSTPLYGRERTLTVVYTGALEGELGPCGCSPKTDFGGMARFAKYLMENKEKLNLFLLIDSGNFSGEDSPQGRLKTETMLRAFSVMNYDAVGLQERDKRLPHDFLVPLLKKGNFKVISDTDDGKESHALDRNGVQVNISIDPGAYRKGKLNILLVHNLPSSEEITNKWDVIIMASGEIMEAPRREGGTIIVSGYPKGKRLGVLALHMQEDGQITHYDHRWEQPGSDYGEDPRVRALLNEYDGKAARLLKDREPPPPGTGYVGAERCAQCHQPYMESWKMTRHANAFASLVRVGKSKDPECVACHSAGFGEPGGFYTLETTPELANVQCESCHGLNRDHIEDYTVPMKEISEGTCLPCHNTENSPEFEYFRYLEKIRHQERSHI